jgi:hypothetical protein
VPAGRRRELLANLSERVEARRNELRREAEPARRNGLRDGADLSDLLELFGDEDQRNGPHERDTSHPDGAEHAAAPPVLQDEPPPPPARRIGALAWVLVVAAAMLVMCVAAALTFVFLLVRANLD